MYKKAMVSCPASQHKGVSSSRPLLNEYNGNSFWHKQTSNQWQRENWTVQHCWPDKTQDNRELGPWSLLIDPQKAHVPWRYPASVHGLKHRDLPHQMSWEFQCLQGPKTEHNPWMIAKTVLNPNSWYTLAICPKTMPEADPGLEWRGRNCMESEVTSTRIWGAAPSIGGPLASHVLSVPLPHAHQQQQGCA